MGHPLHVLVISVALLATAGTGARAEDATPTEHDVKAAFLYNFGKFVTWPENAFKEDGNLVIGVIGEDPIVAVLERTVRDKLVQDKRVDVRRLRSAKDAGGCHIVFISVSEAGRLGDILKALERSSVLTVSDIEGFAEHGGMINLLLEQKKVRFEVNLFVVEQAGLKMSSQLLKLARRVIRPPA